MNIQLQLCDFIDVHSHLLPGLDDGAATNRESLEMARIYAENGVRAVVVTPHFIPGTAWAPSRQKVLDATSSLQEELQQAGINITLCPGMEIAFHRKLGNRLQNGDLLPLGTSNYYLIEPFIEGSQDELYSVIQELLKDDFLFILAHPERIEAFQEDLSPLRGLVEQGARVQVNTGSLLGAYGERVLQSARTIAQQGWLHYLGSDAHNTTSRKPLTEHGWRGLVALDSELLFLSSCFTNAKQLIGRFE